jgi:hypothetical protein
MHFTPHWHIKGHLTLCHEHPTIYLQTDGLSRFNPTAGFVGTKKIYCAPLGRYDIRQNGLALQ